MAPPLLNLDAIRLSFGGDPLLDGAELICAPGERIALVGRNGSGKSTLLKIAAGLIEPQEGTVFRQPDATLRYLEQNPDFNGHKELRAYVSSALGPADDAYRADYLLEQLGLDPAADPQQLSGGEARRAALARVLAPEPDILLLDEPTNHLDIAAIEWLEGELSRRSGAMVIISHDRRFLENTTRATVWLDRGRTRRLERGFAEFEAWRDEILEQEERDAHKLARRVVAEEHWLRYGVTARRKRNMRRLGALHAMREAVRTRTGPQGTVRLAAAEGRETGKLVIEAQSISKTYAGRTLVQPFSIRIHRGDRIGFAGPNGAGKTTLLKMLTGSLAPDTGEVRHGANLVFATFDQRQESLDPTETLQDYLTGGRGDQILVGDSHRHVIAYMKDFLFLPEQARMAIGRLSGGERARLVLAKILARPSNVLVLDEPTNDLDMETLDLLQEVVAGYAGTVLLISHDRDFLDRTVTSLIVPESDGRWIAYAGGYTDMLAQRPAAAATAKGAAAGRAKAAERPDARAAPARKLSYKQKFALENLPRQIADAQAAIASLERELADPKLFGADPERFQQRAAELGTRQQELERLEEEWLELEILREELET